MLIEMDYDKELAGTAEEHGVDTAVTALQTFGCFVLRDALPIAKLQQIHDTAIREYDQMEKEFNAQALTERQLRRNHGYGILRPFEDELLLADGQLMRETILGLVRSSLLAGIIAGTLGEETSLLLEACHIRKQGPGQPGRPVPLHQDCSVMRMQTGQLLNFWVPLVDGAGATAPGLEFYPKSLDTILDCPKRPASEQARERMYSNFEITEEDVRETIGDLKPWRPVLNRGDVLCLDGWTVHRTNFDPAMTETRIGFEVRFCRDKDLQPEMPGIVQAFVPDRSPDRTIA